MLRRLCVLLLLFADARAHAADETPLEQALAACLRLAASAERLACYDRLARSVSTSQLQPPKIASPEEMFGAPTTPTQPVAESSSTEQGLASITSRVKTVTQDRAGRVLLELENGQIWRQESDRDLLLEVGDEVTISRAALSSFILKTPTRRSSRVKRVQ